MPISDHSLLLAVVFTYAAIVILLTTTWLSAGIEPFLRTWLFGTVISLVGAFISAVFYMRPALWVGAISFGALVIGFGVNALTSFQLRTGQLPLRRFGPVILVVTLATVSAMLAGYVGLSIIIWQVWAAVCGAAAAANYWMARDEAPVALTILALFYLALAIPYALSSGILILDGNMFAPRPDNWADQASRLVALLVRLGSVAILLMLSQWRRAGAHVRPA
jgi:hypothetical protein